MIWLMAPSKAAPYHIESIWKAQFDSKNIDVTNTEIFLLEC